MWAQVAASPFGLPRSDNANYLWIQLFYSTLSTKRARGLRDGELGLGCSLV